MTMMSFPDARCSPRDSIETGVRQWSLIHGYKLTDLREYRFLSWSQLPLIFPGSA